MRVIVVANPKGGAGKSTLATNLAGYLASQGRAVMLGDADRQQSSRLWLGLRPAEARSISAWELDDGHVAKPPKGTTHVVLDTPAALHGKRFDEVMKVADQVVVPMQPSIFDIYATRAFLDMVKAHRKHDHVRVGIVGMRVKDHTISGDQLKTYTASLEVPMIGILRDTQNYIQLAARGLTLWDVAPGRVERDLEQWQPILRWIETDENPAP
jgi:chromosome partitioning protein